MSIRVALLGCGRIASLYHGPILARLPGVAITAIADPDRSNRTMLAAIAPAAVHYDDWRLPISLKEADAAVICLPPALHAEAAIAAFEAGHHVYVEKPLALNLEEGRRIADAQALAGTTGMIGFNFRFHPSILAARDRVQSGALGRISALRSVMTSPRRRLPGWKAEPAAGGQALADLATHQLDLLPFLIGSPIDRSSLTSTRVSDSDGSQASVEGSLENGASFSIFVSQLTGFASHEVELFGEKGHQRINLSDAGLMAFQGGTRHSPRVQRAISRLLAASPTELLHNPYHEPSFELALKAFVTAAKAGRPATPDLADGLRVLELVERASAVSRHVDMKSRGDKYGSR